MANERPLAVFYTGTNGSGKSTLRQVENDDRINVHIDTDAIAKEMNPSQPRTVDVAAGKEALSRFDSTLAKGLSFSMETTLTGNGALRRTSIARAAGYEVELRYIGLDSPQLNIRRVAYRVAHGGHHIDDDVIRRRYMQSLEMAPTAACIAHKSTFFDNSDASPLAHLYVEDATILALHDGTLPEWIMQVKNAINEHL